jgi:hypothetical protein
MDWDYIMSETRRRINNNRWDWKFWSRPEQRAPGGDWSFWLYLAGRGTGKTRSGGPSEPLCPRLCRGILTPVRWPAETRPKARPHCSGRARALLRTAREWWPPCRLPDAQVDGLATDREFARIGTRAGTYAPDLGGLDVRQLNLQCARKSGDDVVLHLQEIGAIVVERLGPEMSVALGVDQLRVDANLSAGRIGTFSPSSDAGRRILIEARTYAAQIITCLYVQWHAEDSWSKRPDRV